MQKERSSVGSAVTVVPADWVSLVYKDVQLEWIVQFITVLELRDNVIDLTNTWLPLQKFIGWGSHGWPGCITRMEGLPRSRWLPLQKFIGGGSHTGFFGRPKLFSAWRSRFV